MNDPSGSAFGTNTHKCMNMAIECDHFSLDFIMFRFQQLVVVLFCFWERETFAIASMHLARCNIGNLFQNEYKRRNTVNTSIYVVKLMNRFIALFYIIIFFFLFRSRNVFKTTGP